MNTTAWSGRRSPIVAAALAAGLLLPASAAAINVCGNGICEKTGIPVETSTNCPADCGDGGGSSSSTGLPNDIRGSTSCAWGSYDCNPPLTGSSAIAQVNGLFDGKQIRRSHLLHKSPPQEDLNINWHWQSIQRPMHLADGRFLVATCSVSNKPGRFHVFHLGEEANTGGLFLDGNGEHDSNLQRTAVVADNRSGTQKRNHAGGSQMLGKILGVGLECHGGQSICSGLKAAVGFHDLSTPDAPVAKGNFEVPYTNAGTVSLAKLSDGKYLMIVGEAHAARLNFYISSSLFSGWALKDSWSTSTDTVGTTIGDTNYGGYQNLQLVVDGTQSGKLFLVATHRDGDDWVDLYRLDTVSGQAKLTKVAKRHIYCHGSCNLDAGGGVYVTPAGRLVVYGIEHYPDGCNHECTRMAEYSF